MFCAASASPVKAFDIKGLFGKQGLAVLENGVAKLDINFFILAKGIVHPELHNKVELAAWFHRIGLESD